MINTLEGMSKKELIEIIQTQQQNDIEREAEIKKWKANHDNQVNASRLLRERKDMPVERIRAYDKFLEMCSQLERVTEDLDIVMRALDVISQHYAEKE